MQSTIRTCTEIYSDGEQPELNDKPFKRMGRTPVSNAIEMVALLSGSATLEIEIAGKILRQESSGGLVVFTVPARPGRPIFRITRHGALFLKRSVTGRLLTIRGKRTRPISVAPAHVASFPSPP